MTLEDLGYTIELAQYRAQNNLTNFIVARVIMEHKERYVVKTEVGDFEAELIGNLRYTATTPSDYPVVGDWVAISKYDTHKALIHQVFPRTTTLQRPAVGKQGETQLIATNIDTACIVQAVNRDFNMNRLERYLTMCHASKVTPILILTKIDLISDSTLVNRLKTISDRIKDLLVIPISNTTNKGLDLVKQHIQKGKTYCLLGSSGVGKSTLLNSISDKELMKTGSISNRIDRGKHITTHRALIVLKSGGIMIDNPGMRAVGITNTQEGFALTFEEIFKLSEHCRFSNCTHVHEKDCAILNAIDKGLLNLEYYHNYLRMEREKTFFESSLQDKKRKDKNLGKRIKSAQQNKRRHKY